MDKIKLKPYDMQIIKALLENSEAPLYLIAKRLGMHASTVAYRIKKLKEMGAIRKFTISVDWRKLGKETEVAVLINSLPKNIMSVAEKLSGFEEVIELHSLTGLYDMLAMVTLTNMDEYREFVKMKLGTIEEIENFHAAIVLEDFKEE
jgi:DNA-binding Lrp family transcriptional regulator